MIINQITDYLVLGAERKTNYKGIQKILRTGNQNILYIDGVRGDSQVYKLKNSWNCTV